MLKITHVDDDASHRAALVEIDRLWGAESGTQESEQLDELMNRVDAYERARWPIDDST